MEVHSALSTVATLYIPRCPSPNAKVSYELLYILDQRASRPQRLQKYDLAAINVAPRMIPPNGFVRREREGT